MRDQSQHCTRDVQRGASMIPSFRYFEEIWWGNTRHVDARFFEVIENNWMDKKDWMKKLKEIKAGFSSL